MPITGLKTVTMASQWKWRIGRLSRCNLETKKARKEEDTHLTSRAYQVRKQEEFDGKAGPTQGEDTRSKATLLDQRKRGSLSRLAVN